MDTSPQEQYKKLLKKKANERAVFIFLVFVIASFGCLTIAFFITLILSHEDLSISLILYYSMMPFVLALLGFIAARVFGKYRTIRDLINAARPHMIMPTLTEHEYTKRRIEKFTWGFTFWFLVLAIPFLCLIILAATILPSPIVIFVIVFLSGLVCFFLFAAIRVRRKFAETRDILDGTYNEDIPRKKSFSNRTALIIGVVIGMLFLISCFVFSYIFNPVRLLRKTVAELYRPVFSGSEMLIHPKNKTDFSDGLAVIEIEGKYGYIDKAGNIVIEPRFAEASPFYDGLGMVKLGGKTGFIDKGGEFVIEPQYKIAFPFSDGMACIGVEGKYGFIDKTGEMVIKPRFGRPSSFSDGLACFEMNGKFGYIDKTGEFAIKPVFWNAMPFTEGKASVTCDVNDYRKLIEEYRAEGEPSVFDEITENIVSGYIDQSGKPVILPLFEEAFPFSDGLSYVMASGKAFFIDETGRKMFETHRLGTASGRFTFWYFHEGMVRTYVEEKCGYLDRNGNIAIEALFDSASDFHEGFASVEIGGKHGYIDKTGKMIIQPMFDYVGDFCEGLAYVEIGDKFGYLDKTGNMVIEFVLDRPIKDMMNSR